MKLLKVTLVRLLPDISLLLLLDSMSSEALQMMHSFCTCPVLTVQLNQLLPFQSNRAATNPSTTFTPSTLQVLKEESLFKLEAAIISKFITSTMEEAAT